MRCLCIMFVTAVCFLFLLKLKWPNNKNIYNNRIFEDVISHLQDVGYPIPYSKFSSPKRARNIAKSSFAVEHVQDRRPD